MRAEVATVGELIRLVAEGRLVNAWILASEETDAAVRGLRARRLTDAEDSASESLVRIFDDGQSALRRADPDCPLRAWLRGVITNVLRETRRSQRERTHPAVVGAAATTDAPRVKSRPKGGGVDLRSLTPKQRRAFELRARARSWTSIARTLGISRRAARDRVASAVRRLRKSCRENGEHWAHTCLRSSSPLRIRMPQEAARFMLRMHAEGASYREIARHVGVSSEAVRHRIRRIRIHVSPDSHPCA